ERCEYTTDRSRIKEADALLFRAKKIKRFDLPKERSSHQKYMMFEYEAPHKVWASVNLTDYNGFFNLTSTYAWDSDIPFNKHRNFVVNQTLNRLLVGTDFAKRKRKDVMVAWFSSRCYTQSNRGAYVKELQKYIQVDIYGKCGNLTCETKNHFMEDKCVKKLLDLDGSYKFYLAFENSLCEDYVTEKIFKVIEPKVVPIVMGAVDYSRFLPVNSYIDVRDFESPKALAEYLRYLNTNDHRYNEYLQ
ncbi:hypothetical protein CAPTEDRAFT_75574, partial [Capitella teleta]